MKVNINMNKNMNMNMNVNMTMTKKIIILLMDVSLFRYWVIPILVWEIGFNAILYLIHFRIRVL